MGRHTPSTGRKAKRKQRQRQGQANRQETGSNGTRHALLSTKRAPQATPIEVPRRSAERFTLTAELSHRIRDTTRRMFSREAGGKDAHQRLSRTGNFISSTNWSRIVKDWRGTLMLWSATLGVCILCILAGTGAIEPLRSLAPSSSAAEHGTPTVTTTAQDASSSMMRIGGVVVTLGQWHDAVQNAFASETASGRYINQTTTEDTIINSTAMHSLIDPIAMSELAHQYGLPSDAHTLYMQWLAQASPQDKSAAQQQGNTESFIQAKAQVQLRTELLQRLVPAPTVTENDAYQFYLNNPQLFSRTDVQLHVRQIVVATNGDAQKILSKLQQGVAFVDLIRQYSVDTAFNRAAGGDLGWLGAQAMPPQWVAYALTLQQGQISAPFQLWGKYYILQGIDAPDYQPWPYPAIRSQVYSADAANQSSLAFAHILAQTERSITIQVIDQRFAPVVAAFRASLA